MLVGSCSARMETDGRVKLPKELVSMLDKEAVSELVMFPFSDEYKNNVCKYIICVPINYDFKEFEQAFKPKKMYNMPIVGDNITIPTKLIEEVNLEERITFIGVLKRLEIWSEQKYEECEKIFEKQISNTNFRGLNL